MEMQSPGGTAPQSLTMCRPLIVAHDDEEFVSRVSEQFNGLGWEVYPARSAGEVRRLAAKLPAGVIVMPTEFADQSGWLTCAKLTRDHPKHRVILVGAFTTPDLQRYTAFVGGAALLGQNSSMRSLVDEVHHAANLPLAS